MTSFRVRFAPIVAAIAALAACADSTGTTAVTSPSFARSGGGGNPHFIYATASMQNDGTALIEFKEVGLSSGSSITYLASASSTATYACINRGGKNPNATNKRTVNSEPTSEGTFVVKNGNITGEITLGIPSAGDFSCPGGQQLVLADVSYSNITLKDLTTPIDAVVSPTYLPKMVFVDLTGL